MPWELINGPAPLHKIQHVWKCPRTQTTSVVHKVNSRFHWAVWREGEIIKRQHKPPVMANTARSQVLKYLATLPDFP